MTWLDIHIYHSCIYIYIYIYALEPLIELGGEGARGVTVKRAYLELFLDFLIS